MKVILMNKTTFEVIQFTNVTNIAYDSGTNFYTITGTPAGSYNAGVYNLQIIW